MLFTHIQSHSILVFYSVTDISQCEFHISFTFTNKTNSNFEKKNYQLVSYTYYTRRRRKIKFNLCFNITTPM